MKRIQLALLALVTTFCFSSNAEPKGESVLLGRPRRRGYARPPLRLLVIPSATQAPSVPYTPAQIRHGYGIDQLQATGLGQKIAIVDAYGNQNTQSALNAF